MTFSPLIDSRVSHHEKLSNRNGQPIARIIVHHWAGLGSSGLSELRNPDNQVSSNYIIADGKLYGQVPEEFRSWTSGSFAADAPSINVEIQNESSRVNDNDLDPNSWKISDENWIVLKNLIADLALRYGWKGVAKSNVLGHYQVASTVCPGGYLRARQNDLLEESLRHYWFLTNYHYPNPEVVVPETPSTEGKSVRQLADEVLAGIYGNGEDRKKALGDQYLDVQAEVNRRLGIVVPPQVEEIKPPPPDGPRVEPVKSVAQLIDEVLAGVHGNGEDRRKSLHEQYDEVQAAVNALLAPTALGRSVYQLADEVMRGDHGNGEYRKIALGVYYDAVQAEVNRRASFIKIG